MTDALPNPQPPAPRSLTPVLLVAATIIILAALAAGGYVLREELRRMAEAEPVTPPEVSQALAGLRDALDAQRADTARQLSAMQQEMAALKEQPDLAANLAPVQEKLDALSAQLKETALAPEPTPAAEPAPVEKPSTLLRDYLALSTAVRAGKPYGEPLAVLIPQLDDADNAAIAVLQAHAELGVPEAETSAAVADDTPLPTWVETLNTRLPGLVSIRKTARTEPVAENTTRHDVLQALASIESRVADRN